MPAGVILDTSYLITLANPKRANHKSARRYWRYFAEQAIPRYLPTIVVSEFCIKQEIPPDILRACVVLPFNWDDAIKAASLDFSKAKRGTESRDALKDDVKIIAQGVVKDAAWIITDDADTLFRFVEALRASGEVSIEPIKLEDGFNASHFNAARQYPLDFGEPPDELDQPM